MVVDVPARISRKRIADLVRAHFIVVGYHLVMARREDPELEAAHRVALGAKTSPSPRSRARMERSSPGSRPRAGSPRPLLM